ncbi:MAG TPA: hypothetical protein DCR40_11585 [Prolixibacteraceae bacterium]|nr:hypothetical protein [Prolixibacteraceae bacterium]
MKKTITLISVVMYLFITMASAQPTEVWVARYNGGGVDQLYNMTVDGSSNVYVTGASIQGTAFTTDFLTVKYNSSGVKQWEKSYNGIAKSDDRAYVLAVDAKGNVYVSGGTGYNNSIVTIKYNSLGDTIWIRSYIGPGSGHNWTNPTSIFVDDSGYVYVAGTSEKSSSLHGLNQDYTILKYSPSGVQEWVARHNGPGDDADWVNSMAVDSLGNVYVTGSAGGGSTGSSDSYQDITTIKYNTSGTLLWKKTYIGPGTSSDEGSMITLDNHRNVYVTGTSYNDIVTIKYANDGTELWKKFYNGPESSTDQGTAITVDRKHNVYVTGRSYYSPTNGFDIITIKYDSIGTKLWEKNFNGSASGSDASQKIILDTDGNIYVLGTTMNTTTSDDYQLIKYNPAGTLLWEIKYTNSNGAGNQEKAAALFVDDLNNIYAAGTSTLDYAVVKYSRPTAIAEIPEPVSIKLFPNPSNGRFTINTGNSKIDMIEIYNMLGEKVYDASDFKLLTSAEIDLSAHSKGIYFAKISEGDQLYTQKILIK